MELDEVADRPEFPRCHHTHRQVDSSIDINSIHHVVGRHLMCGAQSILDCARQSIQRQGYDLRYKCPE